MLDDPQFTFRKLLPEMAHPLFDGTMPGETGPAPFLQHPPAELRPAPMPGQDTREICQGGARASDTDGDSTALIAERQSCSPRRPLKLSQGAR